jgi:hypothetical protein
MKKRDTSTLWSVIDKVLLVIAAIMLSPLVFIGLIPFMLVLGALWPLLVLPVIALDRTFPRGEAGFDEMVKSVRPARRVVVRHA